MKILNKILYVLTAVSLFPIIIAYFGYGNTRDLIFLLITLTWVILLFITAFGDNGKLLTLTTIIFGLFVLGDTLWGFKVFFGSGQDKTVIILFGLQTLLIISVLLLLGKKYKSIS